VEQSNPTGTRGSEELVIIFPLVIDCMTFCAVTENTPEASSATKVPARITNSPIKTRRLKKAEREADFFFILEAWVEGGAYS
jgi:hypothetical protein